MSAEHPFVVKKVVHDLGLPTRERCMPNVLAPPRERLLHERLFVSVCSLFFFSFPFTPLFR